MIIFAIGLTRFASLRGTKQSRQQFFFMDCFVVPPRNDAKRQQFND